MIFAKIELPDMIECTKNGPVLYTFICTGTHLPVRTSPKQKQKQPVRKKQRRTASTESRQDTTGDCSANEAKNDKHDSTSQRTMDDDMDDLSLDHE